MALWGAAAPETIMPDLRLPQRSRWDLRCLAYYGAFSGNSWPTFREKNLDCLNLEDGTDKASRKNRQGITAIRCITSQNSADLKLILNPLTWKIW